MMLTAKDDNERRQLRRMLDSPVAPGAGEDDAPSWWFGDDAAAEDALAAARSLGAKV